ncbi:unnamed protein product [Heligmosomoides polygyrus]|uniref:NRXN1 n=1 Tax=Heligmosomoides polygyrus TaxID=6339 RepID=A0A183GL94_HELPZ|nr:unnamed protein product [Heligmosomoides polygyrus]
MLSHGAPHHFTGLLQVEKGGMHRLLFAMLPHEEWGGVNSISYDAALVVGELNDFTISSLEDSLEDFHTVRS